MQSKDTEVLIVGAGPTGLALAATLATRGVSFRLIDKNLSRSNKSKALGVQAGTLEAFDAAIDEAISREMLQNGWPAREMVAHLDQKAPLCVQLGSVPSHYDFILILEQSETERILEGFLSRKSVQVERKTELLSFQQDESGVLARIQGPQGIEEVRSRFLVGCDGAHSTVRHILGIPFAGKAYQGDFILADVKLEWPWEYGVIRNFISQQGVMVCFPMKGTQRYRLILIPHRREATRDRAIELRELETLAQGLCPDRIKILETTWLTRFSVHQRMVSAYHEGQTFLAGDAAHIHNPAGGQGMNLGIQDAINLGMKLSRVLREGASLEILDEYEKERMPEARKVLRGTDAVFRLALAQESAPVRALRRVILPAVLRSRFIQKRMLSAISQVRAAREQIVSRVE